MLNKLVYVVILLLQMCGYYVCIYVEVGCMILNFLVCAGYMNVGVFKHDENDQI